MHSQEQVLKTIQEKNVEFLRLQFSDIQGIVKNVAIPATQMGKALKTAYLSMDHPSRALPGFRNRTWSSDQISPHSASFHGEQRTAPMRLD